MPSGVYKRTEYHNSISIKYGFKKGHIPWNKGKKGFGGEKNHAWKGGKHTDKRGYVYIYSPNHPFRDCHNYVLEHRLAVEFQISRYLIQKEVVHHLNEIKDDNRPENLMGFISESVHQRFHKSPSSVKPSEIIFDGRKFIQ